MGVHHNHVAPRESFGALILRESSGLSPLPPEPATVTSNRRVSAHGGRNGRTTWASGTPLSPSEARSPSVFLHQLRAVQRGLKRSRQEHEAAPSLGQIVLHPNRPASLSIRRNPLDRDSCCADRLVRVLQAPLRMRCFQSRYPCLQTEARSLLLLHRRNVRRRDREGGFGSVVRDNNGYSGAGTVISSPLTPLMASARTLEATDREFQRGRQAS
jgi:hypothetical protein